MYMMIAYVAIFGLYYNYKDSFSLEYFGITMDY